MKVVTWNVNSVRVRLERLLEVLRRHQPDILCLQELKLEEHKFPFEAVQELGYHAVALGQKTYNGVAILSRLEPEDVHRTMEDGVDDPQARLISARIGGVRAISVYVPNGRSVDDDAYPYKLQWLERLRAYLDRHHTPEEPLVLCGDFNVAPEDRDCYDASSWADSVLCHPAARDGLRHVLEWGLTDTLRLHEPGDAVYSWWDYRQLAFPKKRGLRIDFVFASPSLTRACTAAHIDRDERKGKQPSDHAPVLAEFDWS